MSVYDHIRAALKSLAYGRIRKAREHLHNALKLEGKS